MNMQMLRYVYSQGIKEVPGGYEIVGIEGCAIKVCNIATVVHSPKLLGFGSLAATSKLRSAERLVRKGERRAGSGSGSGSGGGCDSGMGSSLSLPSVYKDSRENLNPLETRWLLDDNQNFLDDSILRSLFFEIHSLVVDDDDEEDDEDEDEDEEDKDNEEDEDDDEDEDEEDDEDENNDEDEEDEDDEDDDEDEEDDDYERLQRRRGRPKNSERINA
ncbi:hypothetical protein HZH68_005685 [Vespula germanica]|uniref:Uncharacterized protein n=1 Tax=Vespula germanica TaxID=30212 RepID=A0A834KI57_VESGE|nr:hypothetical protein HZH68_005685 [Vespula germanica]